MNVTAFRKDRKLGVAQGKRVYDLPLNKGEGTGFLVLLISLMTFLAALSLAASFALGSMSERWASGLENKLTIEIPAEDVDGRAMAPGQVREITEQIAALLNDNPAVKSADMLDEEQIQELVSPWLGEDIELTGIPLPGLISVELHNARPETVGSVESAVKRVAPAAKLDTHESWLNDLLRFTGALQFASLVIVLIIGATTVTAIAGAVRARMAVHAKEVELLHLMGAKDDYITKQFQRHALILAAMGGAAGSAAGCFVIALIGFISGGGSGLIPDFTLGFLHALMLVLLPGAAGAIAALTAHVTVLRVLSQMP
jgi:cell division transport system permease protein